MTPEEQEAADMLAFGMFLQGVSFDDDEPPTAEEPPPPGPRAPRPDASQGARPTANESAAYEFIRALQQPATGNAGWH